MALKKIGVRLVAENADKATQQVNKFNQSVQTTQKTAKAGGGISGFLNKASQSAKSFISNLKNSTGASNLFTGALSKLSSGLSSLGGGLSGALSQLTAFTGGIGSAIVATVALTTAMFKLGQRGAIVEQTQMAFSRIVGSVGNAEDILASLRTQVRGTVSDMDLMNLSILGLQGSSDLFRSVVLPNMGKIIDVTNRVAVATGRSAEEIREKFITGLRRSSKLLVDDIGVSVDAAKANEEFARSIGKSVSALTDQEKQAAFAAAAISQLDRIGNEIGGKTGGLVSMQQASASVKNAIDTLGRAFKPVFDLIATGIAAIAGVFQKAANIIAPIIRSIVSYITELIKLIIAIGKFILIPILPIIYFGKIVGKWIIAIFITAIDIIRDFIKLIREALEGVFNSVNSALQKVFGKVEKQTDSFVLRAAEKLAYGGAFIIGAFATGLLKGATYVLQAVNFIAGIVADFLQGLSPPKKGPLSTIDKGGYNVALAWAEGFVGGIKQPVSEAAAYVDEQLGAIGTLSREQVATALNQLDLSIRPFVEQLQIAESQMEAIAGFVDPAAKILERQRKQALQSLLRGETTDTSGIINLDKQLVMLNKIKESEQDRVDQAQLQLTLGQAQIAKQKALLLIQQKRLGEEDKATSAADKAAKDLGGKGAADLLGGDTGLGGIGGAGEPFTLGDTGIANAVAQLKGALSKGAAAGLSATGFEAALSGFNDQTGELSDNLSRIKNSKPGQAISTALSNIPNAIQGSLDTIKGFIGDYFEDIFGVAGVVFTKASQVSEAITSGIDTIRQSAIFRAFDNAVLTPIENWFDSMDFDAIDAIAGFPTKLIESLLPEDFVDLISGNLTNAALGMVNFFIDKLSTFITDLGTDTIRNVIVALVASPLLLLQIGQKALDLGRRIIEGIVNWVTGDNGETSFWESVKTLLTDVSLGEFALGIVNAATGVGGAIIAGIVEAILGSAQDLADAIAAIMPDIHIPIPSVNLGGSIGIGGSGETTYTDTSGETHTGIRGLAAWAADVADPGGQSGIRWTGSGSPNDPRGTYHAQESVIPRFGMIAANAPIRIVPTPQGPFLQGLTQFVNSLSGRMVNSPASMPMQGATTINNTTNNTNMQTTFNVPNQRSAIVMERQRVAGLNLG